MARPLRIEFDGAVYHFTSCGNARKHIYKDDEDRSTILEVLREVNSRFNWLCHAYCISEGREDMRENTEKTAIRRPTAA